jgi:hypothetical protein
MKFLFFLTGILFLYSCSSNQKTCDRTPQQVGEIGSSGAVKGAGTDSSTQTLSDSEIYVSEDALRNSLKNNDLLLTVESDKNYFDSRRKKDRSTIQIIASENDCLRQIIAGLMHAPPIAGPNCDKGRPVFRLVYTLKNTKTLQSTDESNQMRKYSLRYNCNEGTTRDQDFVSYSMIIKNNDAKKVPDDFYNTNICNAKVYIQEVQKSWKIKNP